MKEYENGIVEYTITNGDMELSVLNVGAVITEFSKAGKNIVLRFEDYNSYLDNSTYLGSIVGRSAGRIRDAKIEDWNIPVNFNNKHNLHGNDLHYKFYDVKVSDNSIELSLEDPEGDFPGNATIKVIYTLTETSLIQEIYGNSDKPTIFNMTNHAYFSLDSNKSILDHSLKIEADRVHELDEDLLPVGDINVGGTAFDFNDSRVIGDSFKQGHDQFKYSKYIDHPYKLNGDVELSCGDSKLSITTNQPYLIAYLGNYLGDETNKLSNNQNKDYQSICLETQKKPGDTELVTDYYSKTEYVLR